MKNLAMFQTVGSLVMFGGLWVAAAQAPAVVNAGFANPNATAVAVGSLKTFFVSGIGMGLKGTQIASTIPLPFSIAGISAAYDYNGPSSRIPLPVFAVKVFEPCIYPDGSGCKSQFVAITVQIPFEIPAIVPPTVKLGAPGAAPGHVTFSENGVVMAGTDVFPLFDEVHIVRNCDIFWMGDAGNYCSTYIPFREDVAAVFHADGTRVSSSKPATPGEAILVYAVGLGLVKARVKPGEAPEAPVPITEPLEVSFNPEIAGYDAKPARAVTTGPVNAKPDFAGLIPGAVGIYQINVTIPADLVITGKCYNYGTAAITSNVRLRVTALTSFDEVGICAVANP